MGEFTVKKDFNVEACFREVIGGVGWAEEYSGCHYWGGQGEWVNRFRVVLRE
jgi:hypothetical protein